jgi:hypothetical protein
MVDPAFAALHKCRNAARTNQDGKMDQVAKMANFRGIAGFFCQKIACMSAKFPFASPLAYTSVKKLKRWSD